MCENIWTRIECQSDNNIQGVVDNVKNKVKGKPRGTYQQKPRSNDDLEYISCGSIVNRDNGYLMLANGSLIPEAWEDVYLLVTHNKAPEDWHRVFNDDTMMTI
jgi:hypothetical protein